MVQTKCVYRFISSNKHLHAYYMQHTLVISKPKERERGTDCSFEARCFYSGDETQPDWWGKSAHMEAQNSVLFQNRVYWDSLLEVRVPDPDWHLKDV